MRKELRRWLRRLHDEIHVTSVFVTHDQEEALEVVGPGRRDEPGPDRAGRRARRRSTSIRPAPFVFEFLGHVNRLPVDATHGADTFARPHEIAVDRAPSPAGLPARFVHGAAIGPVARLEFALEPSAQTINVEVPREQFRTLGLRLGDVAYLTPTRTHTFAAP